MSAARRVLVIDAAAERCAVALRDGDRWTERAEPMARGHAERLFPLIDAVMAEAEIRLSEVDVFAAMRGPGSFTGVRLGAAAIRGLALGSGARAVGVDGFAAIAWTAALAGLTGPALIVFGKPPRLIGRRFRLEEGRVAPEGALEPARLDDDPALFDGARFSLGPGAAALSASAPSAPPVEAGFDQPDLLVMARIAAEDLEGASPPSPLYLRPPDAEPSQEARPRRLGPRPAA